MVEGWLAYIWNEKSVFSQYDVLFSADIPAYIGSFTVKEYPHWVNSFPNHPIVFFVLLIVKFINLIVSFFNVFDSQKTLFVLGLSVIPFASALKFSLLFVVFRLLKFSFFHAVFLVLLSVFSFSALIFGSIPESYGLTAFSCVLVLLFFVSYSFSNKYYDFIGLCFSGSVLLMAAPTNLFYLGLLYFFFNYFQQKKGVFISGMKASILCLSILFFTSIFLFSLNEYQIYVVTNPNLDRQNIRVEDLIRHEKAYYYTNESQNYAQRFFQYVVRGDSKSNHIYGPTEEIDSRSVAQKMQSILNSPQYLARTIIPTMPESVEFGCCFSCNVINMNCPYKHTFAYKDSQSFSLILALSFCAVFVLCVGVYASVRQNNILKIIGLSSFFNIIFYVYVCSFIVNTVEFYLYSQLWHISLIFLIAVCIFYFSFFETKLGKLTLVVVVLLMIVGDIHVLNNMFDELDRVRIDFAQK